MFELTELYAYKILFVIEILIAMHLFSFRLKKRNHTLIRYIISFIVPLFIAIIYPVSAEWDFCYTWWYSSLMFSILFGVCFLSLFIVYDTHWQKIFFNSITSYTAQHLAYQIYTLLVLVLNIEERLQINEYGKELVNLTLNNMTILLLCILVIVYIIVYEAMFILFIKKINNTEAIITNFSVVILMGLILIIDVLVNSIVIYNNDGSGEIVLCAICVYNIICCLMLVFIQYFILNTKRLETELYTINQLLIKSEEQYNQSRENMDLINIKCHDMRHKIRRLANGKNFSNEELNEIEESIEIYDSAIKTGNEVLDVILTEKGFRFKGKGIKFTSIIDGEAISFLNESDIYSLFGNIMDNAIDATLKVPNIDERLIDLKIYKTSDFVSVNLKNTFFGKIEFDKDGLPITSNSNKDYHGFGMKSISYIVDKYNGNLSIVVEDGIFNLNILFFNNDSQYK